MSQMFLTIKDIMTNNILTEFHKMETQKEMIICGGYYLY